MVWKLVQGSVNPVYLVSGENERVISTDNPLPVTGGGDFEITAIDTVVTTLITGTVAAAGQTQLVASPGVGARLVVVTFMLQNESANATTMQLGDGVSVYYRCLGQNQGDGVLQTYPPGREWRLRENMPLVMTLSGANSCGYSISYFGEAV